MNLQSTEKQFTMSHKTDEKIEVTFQQLINRLSKTLGVPIEYSAFTSHEMLSVMNPDFSGKVILCVGYRRYVVTLDQALVVISALCQAEEAKGNYGEPLEIRPHDDEKLEIAGLTNAEYSQGKLMYLLLSKGLYKKPEK